MRRLLAGIAIGAATFGVSFAGAKLATVTNPMSSDLDAAQHSIYNAATFDTLPASTGFVRSTEYVLFSIENGLLAAQLTWTAGNADPTVSGFAAHPGSLYSQRVDATAGALWVKTGASSCDTCWTKVTP